MLIADMNLMDVDGPSREVILHLYQYGPRKVYVTNREEPYPEGKLIFSRTDRDGIITHGNQAFVDISGYPMDELIGQPQSILRHPDMPRAAYAGLWESVQHGHPWKGIVKNLRKDGGYYWVFASVVPNIRNGRVEGYTSVRRKPSRMMIDNTADIYQALLSKEQEAVNDH